jgi:hypothetical protein
MGKLSLLVIVLAACSDAVAPLEIESATPAYAPVIGGTTIVLTGSGFATGGAGPNRVVVAGREAPLARTIDDTTIELVVPPAEHPGDAEVVVLRGDRNVRATGILHYSAPPAITSVAPADVLFSSESTTVTLTGSGFLDEAAGTVHVVVDGQLGADVVVTSDTSLTFTAPPGQALVRPDIELFNDRGSASKQGGFRYTPSTRPGLLLFSTGAEFAVFFDPSDLSSVTIPWATTATVRFTAVVRDEQGDYWGTDRSRRFGRIDMRAQRIATPIPVQAWFPTLTRVGGEYLGLERNTRTFGSLDPVTAMFASIGTATLPCCGSYGLASDGATLYFTARQGGVATIASLDRTTGIAGPLVPLVGPPGFSVEEMRFFAGTLYAAARSGSLVTIDPITGVVTPLPVTLGRFTAMELFD